MIRPGLACLVVAGCGGSALVAAPTPAPRTCEARWLTVADDAVDLAPSVDGLLWLGCGALAASRRMRSAGS